ncbi:MAG: F0F1 ATP synthase subunit A [Lachnospiraceae bacterium]|nr:F0F1 ATP synthase subunit A [Lachnospiraceae bacterium]
MANGVATGFNVILRDDPDFYIHQLYPIDFFGTTVYITTTHICTFIVILAIAVLAIFARRSVLKTKDAPSKFAAGVELVIGALINFVNGTMGKAGKKYINYVGTLFLFVFISNISGLFGLRPPTADYGTTLFIALVSFTMIQYAAIRYQKWGYLKGMFEPIFLFFPINVISEIATPVSLSLRLFGNVLAGTVMMALYYGMLPIFFKIGIPSALHVYFDLFSGAIQAYVFCMLTMTFVANKRNVEG